MQVTAGMVKELREKTGAGMMDCKKALTEAEGKMDRAIELLREKGLSSAAKKSGRVAAQGLVHVLVSEDGKTATAVEINSETDFVAKNEEFQEFVAKVADVVMTNDIADVTALLAASYPGEGTVQEALTSKIARIGENMNIRRFEKVNASGVVNVSYVHGGGRIGVLVQLKTEASYKEVEVLGKDIAMQIASMNPKFIGEKDVDPDFIESEKKILMQQALNEGKPADIVEKMVVGRLKKELKETCLLEQKFVKDGEISVAQYVQNCAKEIGKDIEVVGMVRYEVGEGIEVVEEDFAAEVAKQIGN